MSQNTIVAEIGIRLPSIEAIYTDHHGWLHAWLRGKLGCAHHAADLAHDTFVRVMSTPPAPLRTPRAYLASVARGLVIDHWRRRELELAWLETLAALPEEVAPSPETGLQALQALCEIDALLATLKPRVREAFLLAQLDGLSYREIGARLGVGERMVKKYMAQAMTQCLLARLA